MGIPYMDWEEIIPQCDVVSLHMPLLPSTQYFIDVSGRGFEPRRARPLHFFAWWLPLGAGCRWAQVASQARNEHPTILFLNETDRAVSQQTRKNPRRARLP
jgi:hypothetical protein